MKNIQTLHAEGCMITMSMDSLSYCGWYCRRCPGGDCPGCKSGGGDSGCTIKECAIGKDVVTCAVCGEFPCATISPMLEQFPMLASICNEIKELGLDKWLVGQEKLSDLKYAFPTEENKETDEQEG